MTIADPQASVTASSLLNGVEELRDAGAEAIQIGGTVRVVQSSWFGGPPGALTVDGTPIQPPYVIRAIGSAHTLSDAVGFPGGLTDEINALGGNVTVQENDRWTSPRCIPSARLSTLGPPTTSVPPTTAEEIRVYPENLLYTPEHEWVTGSAAVGATIRVGITDYAQERSATSSTSTCPRSAPRSRVASRWASSSRPRV